MFLKYVKSNYIKIFFSNFEQKWFDDGSNYRTNYEDKWDRIKLDQKLTNYEIWEVRELIKAWKLKETLEIKSDTQTKLVWLIESDFWVKNLAYLNTKWISIVDLKKKLSSQLWIRLDSSNSFTKDLFYAIVRFQVKKWLTPDWIIWNKTHLKLSSIQTSNNWNETNNKKLTKSKTNEKTNNYNELSSELRDIMSTNNKNWLKKILEKNNSKQDHYFVFQFITREYNWSEIRQLLTTKIWDKTYKIDFCDSRVFQRYFTANHLFWDIQHLESDKKIYSINNTWSYYNNGKRLRIFDWSTISKANRVDKARDTEPKKNKIESWFKKWNLEKEFNNNYWDLVKSVSDSLNLDKNEIDAIIHRESNFWQVKRSETGSIWIMQLTTSPFKDMLSTDRWSSYVKLFKSIPDNLISQIEPNEAQDIFRSMKNISSYNDEWKKIFDTWAMALKKHRAQPKLNILIWTIFYKLLKNKAAYKWDLHLSFSNWKLPESEVSNLLKNKVNIWRLNHLLDQKDISWINQNEYDHLVKRILNKNNIELRRTFKALVNYNWDTKIDKKGWYGWADVEIQHRFVYAIVTIIWALKRK